MYKINFKLFSIVLLLSAIVSGCSVRNESNITPFVTTYKNANDKNLMINFIGVSDTRDTKVVSTILKDKEKVDEYFVNVDLKTWYEEAFLRELKSLNMYSSKNKAKQDVSINVKHLTATYEKYTMKKDNMKAKVILEIIAKKDNTTHTLSVNLSQSTYKALVLDAEGFDSILNEIMINSVSKSIAKLISKFS